jgi:prophage regulatory protein
MSGDSLLKLKQIIGDKKQGIPAIVPIGKTAWYAGMEAGRFPKPIRYSARAVFWRRSDIERLVSEGFPQGGDA